jgi:hypothetical protein
VQLIVINSNDTSKVPDDSFPKMKERAQAKHFNFPYLFDESQEVAQAYGAERTPEVFVFDKQGQLRHHGAIGDNYDTPSAAKLPHLRAAPGVVVGGKGPSISATQPAGCTIQWKCFDLAERRMGRGIPPCDIGGLRAADPRYILRLFHPLQDLQDFIGGDLLAKGHDFLSPHNPGLVNYKPRPLGAQVQRDLHGVTCHGGIIVQHPVRSRH